MVPVTLPSLLELSLKGIEELVCQFSMRAVSHMAQENRRWREKANEGIIGCSEEEEDEIETPKKRKMEVQISKVNASLLERRMELEGLQKMQQKMKLLNMLKKFLVMQ